LIIDMHCHLYEFDDNEIEEILGKNRDLVIVAVSDDLSSFRRTLALQERFPERVVACAGFHPWNIGKVSLGEIEEILRLAYKNDVVCIGEVGLDKKFVPETFDMQITIFKTFLRFARDIDAFVNIHAPDAWRDVLLLLKDFNINRAMFHWYTGPLDLIPVIGEEGYKISINPAIVIQKKHKKVAEVAPLEYMVFESDGPYEYKGLRLTPLMIKRSLEEVSKIKGLNIKVVAEKALLNSLRLLNHYP
jgi:TatD DNase family protein